MIEFLKMGLSVFSLLIACFVLFVMEIRSDDKHLEKIQEEADRKRGIDPVLKKLGYYDNE